MNRYALLMLALASGCTDIAASLTTPMPVLLGPIDRIGGTPTTTAANRPDDTLDAESASGFWVFYGTAYPALSAFHPSTEPLELQIREASAKRVGRIPLRQCSVRLSGYRAGAYVHFYGGMYGNYRYWNASGVLEETR